jgi:DNA-binding PadR family transcriptional regulator
MSLSHAILGLLTYGPMTGYDLKKVFDKSISQVWAASLSQIYRELSTLEKKGYVTSTIQKQEDRPDKKIYKITQQGKNVFLRWLSDFPEKLSFPKRDEFMLRIFFGSRLEKDQLITEFKRFINQKKQHLETLKDIEQRFDICSTQFQVDSAEKEELFWRLTIKRGQMTLEVLIKWAEDCIKEIKEYYGDL